MIRPISSPSSPSHAARSLRCARCRSSLLGSTAPRLSLIRASVLFAALSVACGDEGPPAAPARVDAGATCEVGTDNCACTSGGGCRDGLLCISRRCLPAEDPRDPSTEPPERPLLPSLRPTDAGASGEPSDAGDASLSPDDVFPNDAAAPSRDAAVTDADAPDALDAG